MKKGIRGIVLLTVATLSIGIFVGCENTSQTAGKSATIKMGTPNGSGIMGGIAGFANEKGFFEEELRALGYEFEVVGFAGAGPAVNEALIGESIDFAVLADFPAITAKSKGVDTTLVAVENNLSNCAIAVSPDSDYKSIEDLVGKKIALPKGTYMQRFFVSLIEDKGFTVEDFEIVQMTNDMESALVSGSVDAIIFTSDNINKCAYINKTARIIEDTIDYPDYSGQSVLVGRSKFIEGNEEVTQAIVRALINARDYALENPQEANELLAEAGSSNAEVIEMTYGFSDSGAKDRYAMELTDQSLEKLNVTKDFLLNEDFISLDFSISDWYNIQYYEGAK